MLARLRIVALLMACIPACALAQAPGLPGNIGAMQKNADADANNWTLYGKNYKAWRYSPLTQINKTNVTKLKPIWSLNTGMYEGFESSPIVVNGTMYFTTPWNHVIAANAKTGKIYWRHVRVLPKSLPLCCDAVNRGPAVGAGKVIFGSLDAHIVALDAKTGKKVWDTEMASYKEGYSATKCPQIIGNKVICGISGGDFGIRGFIDAYDINSGKRLWRFWTIPGPGQPGHSTWAGADWKHGGGPCWMTPTYDAATNTIFAGVGNPGPDLYRPLSTTGANLYTECTIALDANTGKLKWHYQTIPHDVWDLDNVIEPVLDDITYNGRKIKAVMWAGKNGYFYVLDRTNGKFIYALKYVDKLNWGYVDSKGVPHPDPAKHPKPNKFTLVYPGASGGKEWVPVAYDPKLKRMFIPVIELGHNHKVIRQEFRPGQPYWGGVSDPVPDSGYGHVVAIDVQKKKIAWNHRTTYPVVCGVTCTASGLVITGTPDQWMLILDANTGKTLWKFQAPSGWHSAPVVFGMGGKEYIAFANGWGGWVTGFNSLGTAKLAGMPNINHMYVFGLP